MTLGQRLVELREERGWTQEELAGESGVSVETIRRIETNRTRPLSRNLKDLAQALGIELTELTSLRESRKRSSLPSANSATASAEFVRQLLLNDMIAWRKRPLFPAAETSELARMSLERLYVEPEINTYRGGRRLARAYLCELLAQDAIVVVTAPFGHGKSLTARALACDLACVFAESVGSSVDCWWPVYAPLGRHISSINELDIELLIRRESKLRAESLGYDEDILDAGYAPPPSQQRTLIILDGLDEVHLSHDDIQVLFRRLRDRSTARRRFLIFTRPEVLPAPERMTDVRRVSLEPFGRAQITQWLAAWNLLAIGASPIQCEDLEQRGLREVASTPVLLFLIAYCWDQYILEEHIDEASLYEHFTNRLIRGKLEESLERQPRVDDVAAQLVPALGARECIANNEGPQAAKDAVSWLVARIAWLDHVVEHESRREISEQDIADVLSHELGILSFDPHGYRVTLLLGHQQDENPQRRSVFFGHRSFREFFVARHWVARLKEILRFPERRAAIESELQQAPLMISGSRYFHFLRMMLGRFSADQRARLASVGYEWFAREQLRWGPSSEHVLWNEQNSSLRNVGLMLHCELATDVIAIAGPQLRSMLAVGWASRRSQMLWAPRLECENLDLGGVELQTTNLNHAVIPKARFDGAVLDGATMRQAHAQKASLARVSLTDGDLTGSIFDNANFDFGDLQNVHARGASLMNSTLVSARLNHADLRDAKLAGADLSWAMLAMAQLRGADLRDAKLSHADLDDTDLMDATLIDVDMFQTSIGGAQMVRADLRGAKLEQLRYGHAGLVDCKFQDTKYDSRTTWPSGFDPSTTPGLVAVELP
jgi:uncharacterized protein YjbI with pentapeptide repeats/transcriptional regulator with XRE-family HTH domain